MSLPVSRLPLQCLTTPVVSLGTETLQKTQKAASKNAIKGSLYPEFDYLYAQESRRRKAVIQKEKEQVELTIRRTNDNWNSIPPMGDFGGDHSDGEADDGGHRGYDDDPYQDDGDDHFPSLGGDHDSHFPQADGPSSHGALTHAADPDNMAAPMSLDDEPDHAEVETYEDMCRHQIVRPPPSSLVFFAPLSHSLILSHKQENYLAQAQKYDQHLETSLSKRVREWEDKIKPLLSEQDSRPYFNVRQTGQEVIDTFQEKGVKQKGALTLKQVVGPGAQVYEVIRIFMASLHLANSGNVDIKTQGVDMSLVLKSTHIHELEV